MGVKDYLNQPESSILFPKTTTNMKFIGTLKIVGSGRIRYLQLGLIPTSSWGNLYEAT